MSVLSLALLLAAGRPGARKLEEFGARQGPVAPPTDWASMGLILIWAGVIVFVVALAYRRIRAQQGLEGRGRKSGDGD